MRSWNLKFGIVVAVFKDHSGSQVDVMPYTISAQGGVFFPLQTSMASTFEINCRDRGDCTIKALVADTADPNSALCIHMIQMTNTHTHTQMTI